MAYIGSDIMESHPVPAGSRRPNQIKATRQIRRLISAVVI